MSRLLVILHYIPLTLTQHGPLTTDALAHALDPEHPPKAREVHAALNVLMAHRLITRLPPAMRRAGERYAVMPDMDTTMLRRITDVRSPSTRARRT